MTGTSEEIQVAMTRYHDARGRPTCLCDLAADGICPLLRTQRYGLEYVCAVGDGCDGNPFPLKGRDGADGTPELGTLIPGSGCLVWKPKEIEEKP